MRDIYANVLMGLKMEEEDSNTYQTSYTRKHLHKLLQDNLLPENVI